MDATASAAATPRDHLRRGSLGCPGRPGQSCSQPAGLFRDITRPAGPSRRIFGERTLDDSREFRWRVRTETDKGGRLFVQHGF